MQMHILVRTKIVDINSRFSPYPQFIIRIYQQVTTIYHFTGFIHQQQISQVTGSQIQLLHSLSYGTYIDAIICSRNYLHDNIILKNLITILRGKIRVKRF